MNLPNKLTIVRVILIPFYVFFLLNDLLGVLSEYIALVIFIIASLTDFLDGKIARKYNLVTNFGKFMDPLADKLLVSAALICFVGLSRIPPWVAVIIISREFIISGFRLVAVDNGKVIAASFWGKFKTVSQMAMLGLLHFNTDIMVLKNLTVISVYVALIMTIVSLLDYIYKNQEVIQLK